MNRITKLVILLTIALLTGAGRCQTYYEPEFSYSACVINKSSDPIATIKYEGYYADDNTLQNRDTWFVTDDQFGDGYIGSLSGYMLDNIRLQFTDIHNDVIIDTTLPWKVVDPGYEVQYLLTLQADTTLTVEHLIKPL